MVKKFLSVFAIASMMLATSCSNDEFDSLQTGNEATVSFTAQLPDGLQTKSRAVYGDGETATTLSYAVYEVTKDGWTLREDLGKTDEEIHMTKTVSLRLVNGNEYAVVFWADAPSSIYDFDTENIKVTADYTKNSGVKSNDEKLDAFFAVETIIVNGDASKNVDLKRPFAQLNIGTADLDKAQKAGITVAEAGITVDTYTSFDFKTQDVTGEATKVTFGKGNLPNDETFPVTGYTYLTMNYLLMPKDKQTVDVTLDYGGKESPIYQNVPLQRNYRTNIYGNLLTSQNDFNVEIKPGFDGEYNGVPFELTVNGNNYSTFADAVNAINADNTTPTFEVALCGDEEWATGNAGDGATTCFINSNAVVNIDLKGHAISMTGQGAFKSNAKVNFKNGTIIDKTAYLYENGETAWEFTYLEFTGAEMAFNNVVFNNSVMFQSQNAQCTDCSFKGVATNTNNQSNEYSAWVNYGSASFTNCKFGNGYRGLKLGGDMYGSNALSSVTVDGCEFNNLSNKPGIAIDSYHNATIKITNSSFIDVQPGEKYLYIYETDNVTPTLSNNTITFNTVEGFQSFANCVNQQKMQYRGYTFQLGSDIDLNGISWNPIGVTNFEFEGTFDGNGHAIKNLKISKESILIGDNDAVGLFGWLNGVVKNLTIENANVFGHKNVGVIAGAIQGIVDADGINILNCKVKGANVKATYNNNDADGGKCGGLVGLGYGIVKQSNATNVTITAVKDAGQLVGAGYSNKIINCSATNVSVDYNNTDNGQAGGSNQNIKNELLGRQL